MLSLFFQGSAFESQLVPAEGDLFQKSSTIWLKVHTWS